MFDLCKILGVEEGEVFKLNGCKYKVVRNKMYHPNPFPDNTEDWIMVDYPLNLLAEAEIERQPFVPQKKQVYYYVDIERSISKTANDYYEEDRMRIKSGNCFRTEKEAREIGVPLMEQWKKELGW